jgi:hypothetical protein
MSRTSDIVADPLEHGDGTEARCGGAVLHALEARILVARRTLAQHEIRAEADLRQVGARGAALFLRAIGDDDHAAAELVHARGELNGTGERGGALFPHPCSPHRGIVRAAERDAATLVLGVVEDGLVGVQDHTPAPRGAIGRERLQSVTRGAIHLEIDRAMLGGVARPVHVIRQLCALLSGDAHRPRGRRWSRSSRGGGRGHAGDAGQDQRGEGVAGTGHRESGHPAECRGKRERVEAGIAGGTITGACTPRTKRSFMISQMW